MNEESEKQKEVEEFLKQSRPDLVIEKKIAFNLTERFQKTDIASSNARKDELIRKIIDFLSNTKKEELVFFKNYILKEMIVKFDISTREAKEILKEYKRFEKLKKEMELKRQDYEKEEL